MSNRVSVEIDAKVSGFQKGMKDASDSMKQYETDTRKISESTVNFKKELGQAKREVMNLAAGYAKLSQEAKNSDFGKEMKRQLEQAKEAAAGYIDMQGDLSRELKNLASDTRALDTLSEGVGLVGNAFAATTGLIAQFTGNEEDARRAVVAFTTAQSILNTVIQIANVFQEQSNLMLATKNIQEKAATNAINTRTAAETRGTVATKGATIAQAAFNKVAKANPYVLLATALITVVGALTAFVAMSGKSEAQQKREEEETQRNEQVHSAYHNKLQSELSETMTKYTQLQVEWRGLMTVAEKTEWLEKNRDKFHELGIEVNDVKDAENILVNNTDSVKRAFLKRAESAALAAKATQIYNNALDRMLTGKKNSVGAKDAAKYGITSDDIKDIETSWFGENQYVLNASGIKKYNNALLREAENEATEVLTIARSAGEEAGEELYKAGVKGYNKASESGGKGGKNSSTTNAKETLMWLAKAEQDLNEKNKELQNTNPFDTAKVDKINKERESLQKLIHHYKVLLGLETEEQEVPEITIQGDPLKKIFSGNFDKTSSGISSAMSDLKKYAENTDWSSGTDKWGRSLDDVAQKYRDIGDLFKEVEDEQTQAFKTNEEIRQEKIQETVKKYQTMVSVLNSVGNAFASLKEMDKDNPVWNIAGTVAQALANVALAYSETLAKDKTSKSNIWTFIASAAAATVSMISTLSAIHSGTGYAEGGIVGGSSYAGDRVMARLNSGEMVLNKRQQRSLFNLLDTSAMPQSGGTNVQVHGVVRGTDLILVQKNTNKVRSKAGLSVDF